MPGGYTWEASRPPPTSKTLLPSSATPLLLLVEPLLVQVRIVLYKYTVCACVSECGVEGGVKGGVGKGLRHWHLSYPSIVAEGTVPDACYIYAWCWQAIMQMVQTFTISLQA